MIAALYIDQLGPYPRMEGVDCWGESRDARLYDGPHPVVAHPPCKHWGKLAHLAHVRCTRCGLSARKHDRGCPGCGLGDEYWTSDAGCGPRAVEQVRRWGGVLEHPAWSRLWEHCGLPAVSSPAPWAPSHKGDRDGCALADRHYSRRKVGAPQFMPPGQTLCLKSGSAVWGWWRPHPNSGLRSMNGLDGWTCSIFRNESEVLSSRLILGAEVALAESGLGCGADGMLTYVFDSKVKSCNPGFCYKKAGWRVHPTRPRSADGRKTLLWKPFSEAGIIADAFRGYTVEVNQVEWGHVARKPTWLYLVGVPREALEAPPFPGREPTHHVSRDAERAHRNGYTLKRTSSAMNRRTPPLFAEYLVRLARAAGKHRTIGR